MVIDNILTLGQIAAALSAMFGLLLLTGRYFIVRPLDKRIIEKTQQIQPNQNGGKSLSDVALAVNRVERKVENVIKRVEKLEESLCK